MAPGAWLWSFCDIEHMKIRALLALLTILLVGCGKQMSDPQVSDPLLAAGEQAFVGSYKLDNVLLGPGKVVLLPGSILEGMGDTLEQAATKGNLTSGQTTTLQQNCIMEVLVDHTFTISNLPAADFSRNVSIKGNWSVTVYHVMAAYGYRISMKGGPKGDLALARFFNADKPEPPVVQIDYREGQLGQVTFRFAKTNNPSLSKPLR